MAQVVLSWLKRQVTGDAIASGMQRMIVAFVPAILTYYALEFILVRLTGWLPEEAVTQASTLFFIYFLFGIYYFLLCHSAFGDLEPIELEAALKRTRPESQNAFEAFISGESGTSHATMFSIIALIGVGAISFYSDTSGDSSHNLLLRISGLLAVIGSWISNAPSFALQYARDDADDGMPVFQFPEGVRPRWSYYLYVGVMVSATLSTGDVTVVTSERRRMVALHVVIAFTFNTVIIAMLIATLMT